MSRGVLREEWFAALALLMLFVLAMAQAELYRRYWVLGWLGSMFVWMIAIMWTTVSIPSKVRRYEEDWPRFRAGAALPVALVAAFLLGPAGRWSAACLYLQAHEADMAAARAVAGPDRAASIPYLHGIPDGGAAIIDSPRSRPEALDATEQLRLTGGRIHSCRQLRTTSYVCSYG